MKHTQKHEALLTFYSGILNAVDLQVDETGEITYAPPGAVDKDGSPMVRKAIVDNKRWVLPTKDVLAESPWETHIAFHPLSENIMNKDSVVINKLKAVMNVKLGLTIGQLMLYLTQFAADSDKHGSVPAKAGKFLKLVPNIKNISVERIADIVDKSEGSTDKRFVNMYIKPGGKILDSRFSRAAIVTFPFRSELEGDDGKIFGVTISQKDRASFKALFDYILPGSQEPETYSAGSTSTEAPSFESLLNAFTKVATQLNEVITTHKKVIPTYKHLMIDLSWVEHLGEMDAMVAVVPPLPGNIGDPTTEPRPNTAVKPAAAKVTRLFDQTANTTRAVPAQDVVRVEQARPAVTAEATKPNEEGMAPGSFAERMARMKASSQQAAQWRSTAQPERGNGGYQSASRSYTAGDTNVPAWAQEGGSTRVLVGDDPKNRQIDSRDRPREAPERSWAERMRGADINNYSGGSRYSRNGRFEI